jgi:hypothetical protein
MPRYTTGVETAGRGQGNEFARRARLETAEPKLRLQFFHVRNVGRLSDVELSFSAGKASPPRSWTVLTGINGTGKTSLLQAMALGLSGPEVRKEIARPPGRGPAQHGVLRSELVDLEAQTDQVVELRLDPGEGEWIAHLSSDRGSESADALVLAYGIHRSLCRLEEALPARGELELLAVGSLFGPRLPPLGPRFRKFFEEADEFGKRQRFAAALREAVLASDGSGPLLEWVDGRRLGHRKSGLTSLQEDLEIASCSHSTSQGAESRSLSRSFPKGASRSSC